VELIGWLVRRRRAGVSHFPEVPVDNAPGAIIGADTAALLLVTIDNKLALEVAIIIFCALAFSIRGVNYALYCAAVAAAVLIGLDLPHPHNLGDEGRRVLFTFVGVGIAVVVMFLANLLQKRLKPATAPT
jgi:uncharacterized membrane protein YgaE (UPF0421/DUF939 family)